MLSPAHYSPPANHNGREREDRTTVGNKRRREGRRDGGERGRQREEGGERKRKRKDEEEGKSCKMRGDIKGGDINNGKDNNAPRLHDHMIIISYY